MGNINKVKQWSKKDKAYTDVDRPEIIKCYNDFMGGVDLMDRLISYYSMTFRTKRWPTRVILHLLSMSVVNSWIKYREKELKKGVSRQLVMDLLSFWEELADSLCESEVSPARFRGRPSMRSLLNYTPVPRKKTSASVLLSVEFRHDGFWSLARSDATEIRSKMSTWALWKKWADTVSEVQCVPVSDKWSKLLSCFPHK